MYVLLVTVFFLKALPNINATLTHLVSIFLPLWWKCCLFKLFLETAVNLISELITERLTQSHVSSEGQTSLSATLTIAEETSQMAIDDGSSESRSSECSSLLTEEKTDFLALRETPFMCQTKQLKFLADSYNRTMNEEKNFAKVIFTGIALKWFEMCLYNIIMCEISHVHTYVTFYH